RAGAAPRARPRRGTSRGEELPRVGVVDSKQIGSAAVREPPPAHPGGDMTHYAAGRGQASIVSSTVKDSARSRESLASHVQHVTGFRFISDRSDLGNIFTRGQISEQWVGVVARESVLT